MRRRGMSSDTAWMTIDRVADPARMATISGVQSAGAAEVGKPARWNQTSPAMATMLARAGAHMYPAKRPWALSTWPRIV